MPSRTNTPLSCSVCDKQATQICSKCKQLHPVHKYLCGKNVSTFFVPPLSQAEADKIDSLRSQRWDHKCDSLCRCPKVEPPESTLFDLVRSLGLYEGEWKTFLSRLSIGGDLLPEPQLSVCLFLARSQLFTKRSEYPTVKTSIGLESFNLHCQLTARLITYRHGSGPLKLDEWNPLLEFNRILRLHLSWAVAVITISDPVCAMPSPFLAVHLMEKFLSELQSVDTSRFDLNLQEVFEGWLTQCRPAEKGTRVGGVTQRHGDSAQ
ncbi:hypothetical protein JCM5350_004753 [Sporobolomyces pararoseus]